MRRAWQRALQSALAAADTAPGGSRGSGDFTCKGCASTHKQRHVPLPPVVWPKPPPRLCDQCGPIVHRHLGAIHDDKAAKFSKLVMGTIDSSPAIVKYNSPTGAAAALAAAAAAALPPGVSPAADTPPLAPAPSAGAGGGVAEAGHALTYGSERDAVFGAAPDETKAGAVRQLRVAQVMEAYAARLREQLAAGDAAGAAATLAALTALASDEKRRARAVAVLGEEAVAHVEEALLVEELTCSGDSTATAELRKALLGEELRRRRRRRRTGKSSRRAPGAGASSAGRPVKRAKGEKLETRKCYRCDKRGHISPNCPLAEGGGGSSGSSSEDGL